MTAPPIAFPDVEALVLVALRDALPGTTVVVTVPNPRPPTFVRVLRTGGPRDGLVIDEAQVTVEAWDTTTAKAAGLARLVRAHLVALSGRQLGGVQLGRVREFAGPANFPDPTSGSPRYSWTVQVPVRGAAL